MPYDFVGSVSNGTSGVHYEGGSNETINAIALRATTAVPRYGPNVVLLQADTIDVKNGEQDDAPGRLASLIDNIQLADPTAVAAVATLGPATDATLQGRIATYNGQIRRLVQNLQGAGRRVARRLRATHPQRVHLHLDRP